MHSEYAAWNSRIAESILPTWIDNEHCIFYKYELQANFVLLNTGLWVSSSQTLQNEREQSHLEGIHRLFFLINLQGLELTAQR